jgi:NADH:ubiquinone reductase (H+-translocating)
MSLYPSTPTIRKEGIEIKTAHHDKISVIVTGEPHEMDPKECLTLHTKEEGDVGVGMSIWTTGNTTQEFS